VTNAPREFGPKPTGPPMAERLPHKLEDEATYAMNSADAVIGDRFGVAVGDTGRSLRIREQAVVTLAGAMLLAYAVDRLERTMLRLVGSVDRR